MTTGPGFLHYKVDNLVYPILARDQKIQGKVEFDYSIVEGKGVIVTLKSDNPLLEKAARENLTKWVPLSQHHDSRRIVYTFFLLELESEERCKEDYIPRVRIRLEKKNGKLEIFVDIRQWFPCKKH
jgi:hypothetical protein